MAKTTIKQLMELKGQRKLALTTAFDFDTDHACELGGIDIIVTWPQHNENMDELRIVLDQVRKGTPNVLIGTGIPVTRRTSARPTPCAAPGRRSRPQADLIYSSGMEHSKFKALAHRTDPLRGPRRLHPSAQHLVRRPTRGRQDLRRGDAGVRGHAGLPGDGRRCGGDGMRTGGQAWRKRSVGRVDLLVFSMGSGAGCDGQFLFSCDIWGTHDRHYHGTPKSTAISSPGTRPCRSTERMW